MISGSGLDWPGMMSAGLRELRLHPDQFWALTPAELALMLGIGTLAPRMTRSRLADLAARYPDASGSPGGKTAAHEGDEGNGDV